MVSFPNAKINLGLKILRKRSDGFHEIETAMYPVGVSDVLEIIEAPGNETTFRCTGIDIDNINGSKPAVIKDKSINKGLNKNLVLKLYEMLSNDFRLPPAYIHLHKVIPAGAGLGGGSSDCAFALQMFNRLFNLGLSLEQQAGYAMQLGSDCAFFLCNKPSLATGRGEVLNPVNLDLNGLYLYLVKPDVHISTAEAYAWIRPEPSKTSVVEIINTPLPEWKSRLFNDFETPVFNRYPDLIKIKKSLYEAGAVYAAMSGSGSAFYGLFDRKPKAISFPCTWFQWIGPM